MVPFFLSALLFLSAFFAIFSPLPILFSRYRLGRGWSFLAALSNSLIVLVAGGGLSLATYLVFVVATALLIPPLLRPGASLGGVALKAFLGVALAGGVAIATYSQFLGINPWSEFQGQVSTTVDFLTQSLPPHSAPPTPEERTEWKRQILVEFPSVVAIFSLLLIWANLVILLRANPAGVREKMGLSAGFTRDWRAPETLLWVTISSGGLMVVDLYYPTGVLRDVALNVFRVMMAIYAIQGLSILAFFFDSWNVRGFLRVLGMMMAVFLMMPLLLSLGFFDQLFDFRARIRQS
jgi:hypothetical protein